MTDNNKDRKLASRIDIRSERQRYGKPDTQKARLLDGWIAILNACWLFRVGSMGWRTAGRSEIQLVRFQVVFHESKSDIGPENMKGGQLSRWQVRKTDGVKDSQKAGMKSVFHRENRPKHRLGKMSDKKMVCGDSGQRGLSHLAK
jgi:hypothetical protein